MKAVLNDTVIAEAPKEDLIHIEGNWYFPPASVELRACCVESATPYTCPWKGECQYFSVKHGEARAAGPRVELPDAVPELVRPGGQGLQQLRRVLEGRAGRRLTDARKSRTRGRAARRPGRARRVVWV